MKKIFAIFVLILGVNAFADAFYDKEMWDGSFSYNYIRLQEVNDGFELSLTGSHLGLQLGDISFKSWSWIRPILFIKFKTGECIKNADESVRCVASEPDRFKDIKIFVQQSLQDIDDQITIISPTFVKKIELRFDPKKAMELALIGARSREATDIQRVELNFEYTYEHEGLGFPQRLRDYLAQE